jgi:hypothetical protein
VFTGATELPELREQGTGVHGWGGIWTHFPDRIAYRFVEVRPLS